MHDGKQVHNHLVSQDGTHGDKPSPLHKKLIADHVTAAKKHLDKMAGHIFSDEDDMDESVTQNIDLGALFEEEDKYTSKSADDVQKRSGEDEYDGEDHLGRKPDHVLKGANDGEDVHVHHIKSKKTGKTTHTIYGTPSGHQSEAMFKVNGKADPKHIDHMYRQYNESVTQKIDLGTLFEGEEFSEEFKSKAGELFEAAVEARIKQEVARIEEEVSQRSVTESAELKEGLVDKVDGYLDYVVEQWMQKNELALDRGIKVEIFESFVSGMKDLFETHYIDVPEEKFDLMESVDAKAKTLEEQVDFLTAQNVELQQKFKTVAKEKQIEEACKELTDLEAERFKQLSEELAYDDEESFGKKLELVKENYISKSKQAKSVIVDSVVTDSPVEINEEKQVDASMARYMNAFKAR
jgi:hypothetical protein